MPKMRITRRECLNLIWGGAAYGLAACAAPMRKTDADTANDTANDTAQSAMPAKVESMAQVAPTATAINKAMPAAPAPTAMPVANGPLAPSIASEVWLNTPQNQALSWDSLRGQVVAVEFWTLGCINCQHVIPSLIGMYADYKDKGFTIVGVHTPEFDYEKKLNNVKQALAEWKIEYPIAIDNDFENWNRYRNRYWPALYLIDKRGIIRHTHIGEGGEDETRGWIERLI